MKNSKMLRNKETARTSFRHLTKPLQIFINTMANSKANGRAEGLFLDSIKIVIRMRNGFIQQLVVDGVQITELPVREKKR